MVLNASPTFSLKYTSPYLVPLMKEETWFLENFFAYLVVEVPQNCSRGTASGAEEPDAARTPGDTSTVGKETLNISK
jgi:hypothetical protein